MSAPVTSRPTAPKAYGFSTQKKGMLSWEKVRDALAAATLYWIGTTRPDGSSQIHPIWGGWVGETGYFEGGDTTRYKLQPWHPRTRSLAKRSGWSKPADWSA